jgi:hypothetical protein
MVIFSYFVLFELSWRRSAVSGRAACILSAAFGEAGDGGLD